MLRTSLSQFECMVQFMLRNGDLNRLVTSDPPARLIVKNKWEELTASLNSDATGMIKSVEKWRKVWTDLKNHTKKKALRIAEANSDGSGIPSKLVLSQLEENVLKIIGFQPPRVKTIIKPNDPRGSLNDPLEKELDNSLLHGSKVNVESVDSNGDASEHSEDEQNDTDQYETIEHDSIQYEDVEVDISNYASINEMKRDEHKREESPEIVDEIEARAIIESNKVFVNIIEQELLHMPKRRRVECMQELLEVVKKYNSQ